MNGAECAPSASGLRLVPQEQLLRRHLDWAFAGSLQDSQTFQPADGHGAERELDSAAEANFERARLKA